MHIIISYKYFANNMSICLHHCGSRICQSFAFLYINVTIQRTSKLCVIVIEMFPKLPHNSTLSPEVFIRCRKPLDHTSVSIILQHLHFPDHRNKEQYLNHTSHQFFSWRFVLVISDSTSRKIYSSLIYTWYTL